MSRFILYLFEAAFALTLMYSFFYLILRKSSVFQFNRVFLLLSILVAALAPYVSWDFKSHNVENFNQSTEDFGQLRLTYYEALEDWTSRSLGSTSGADTAATTDKSIHWSALFLWLMIAIYGIGVVFVLYRMFWSFTWIRRMIKDNPGTESDGMQIVVLDYPVSPFSFFGYVFIHHQQLDTDEFVKILQHEKTHVRQWHTLDLIFVQLAAAFLWFNPLIWQLIRSLKTTHEYIADKQMMARGYSLVEYQTLLLRQLVSNNSYGLVHNFNLSFIKKRITMMKNQESGWLGMTKITAVLLCTLTFGIVVMQCNSKMDEQLTNELVNTSSSSLHLSIDLPLLPNANFGYSGDLSDAVTIQISNDVIVLDGQQVTVENMAQLIESSELTKDGIVIMHVDKRQSMKLVTDVQTELRRTSHRKLLYLGQTADGTATNMPFLLPPLPGAPNEQGIELPKIDDEYIARTGLDVLRIDLGGELRPEIKTQVDEMIRDHLSRGSSNYVVSAKAYDHATFGSYLTNLGYIQDGFNQIYQERCMEMFGVNFYELDRDLPEDKEKYLASRKGLPRAISIAERD